MNTEPRKFVSASVSYVAIAEYERSDGMHRDVREVIVAVADDGTAWIRGSPTTPVDIWMQIVLLPDRTP